jgi:uncharacterized membrane protein
MLESPKKQSRTGIYWYRFKSLSLHILRFYINEKKKNQRIYIVLKNTMAMTTSIKSLEQQNPKGFSIERLSLFSDAVFAIAITLLAIDIRVIQLPENLILPQLDNEIIGLLPKFISFILSFFIIGSYWISYHRTIYLIKRYDQGLISLNLLFLMFIVLVPFPNDLIGKYPANQSAVIVYAVLLAATGLSMCLLWIHASKGYHLVDETLHPKFIRYLTLRLFISPSIFLISIPISFFNPLYSMVTWFFGFPIGIYFEHTHLKINIHKEK